MLLLHWKPRSKDSSCQQVPLRNCGESTQSQGISQILPISRTPRLPLRRAHFALNPETHETFAASLVTEYGEGMNAELRSIPRRA